MIMVNRTISFTDIADLNQFINDEDFSTIFKPTFELLREELNNRQTLHFTDTDEENLTFTQTFIWESQEKIDSYLQWAEETHNYTGFYNNWTNYINSRNGTVIITQTDI